MPLPETVKNTQNWLLEDADRLDTFDPNFKNRQKVQNQDPQNGQKWSFLGSGRSNLGSKWPKMGSETQKWGPEGQIWGQGTQKWVRRVKFGVRGPKNEVRGPKNGVQRVKNDPNLGSKSGSKVKVGANKGFQPKMVQKGQFWGENWVLTRILSQKSNWQTQNP